MNSIEPIELTTIRTQHFIACALVISLPLIFIIIGLILEKRIYTSFTKNGIKRNRARVFASIFLVLVLLILYVAPYPYMTAYFTEEYSWAEYPWARLIRLTLIVGSLVQIACRILNEVMYGKKSKEN